MHVVKTLDVLKVGIFLWILVWNIMCQRQPLCVPKPACSPSASIKGRICSNILPYSLYLCRNSFILKFQCVYKYKLTSLIIVSLHRDGSFKLHRNLPKWPAQGHLRSHLCHLAMDTPSVKYVAASLQIQIHYILWQVPLEGWIIFFTFYSKAPTCWSFLNLTEHPIPENPDFSPPLSYLMCPKSWVRIEHEFLKDIFYGSFWLNK